MALFDWQTFLLLALVFIPLERILAMHEDQKLFRRGWITDLVYVLCNGWIIKVGTILFLSGALVGTRAVMPEWIRAAVESQPIWLQTIEVLLIADVGFYLVHRAFHTFPILWRFHAVHHSIEELDWLAGHRVHPVDQILTKGATMLPCFALGFSEIALGIYVLIYQWHSVMLHANIHIPFGPLRWLIASPEFHHWHHCDHPEAYDKNFAGQLSFLDVVFGTAHMTNGQLPTKYGCSDPVPEGYLAQLAYPFRNHAPDRSQESDALAQGRQLAHVPPDGPDNAPLTQPH